MATAIRPIGHDDRLSIVEHLDELRTRLVICAVALVAAFSFCYWQNDAILDLINAPLEETQNLDGKERSGDPLEQSARFQLQLGESLRTLGPAIAALQRSQEALSREEGISAGTRDLIRRQTAAIEAAALQAREAAAAVPTNLERQPVTLGVAEPFLTTISVSLWGALLIALPLILYQIYAFVLPAFSPRERRAAIPLMAMVPVLFMGGVAFGYLVALPRAVDFLQNFNDDSFDILLQAKDFYRFSIMFLALMGVLFQIPVGVLAITRLRIVSTKQLRKQRGIVILVLAIAAAVATPTPDPVTMLLAMGPLVLLFELSLVLARIFEPTGPTRWDWGEDDDEEEDEEEDDAWRDDDLYPGG